MSLDLRTSLYLWILSSLFTFTFNLLNYLRIFIVLIQVLSATFLFDNSRYILYLELLCWLLDLSNILIVWIYEVIFEKYNIVSLMCILAFWAKHFLTFIASKYNFLLFVDLTILCLWTWLTFVLWSWHFKYFYCTWL